DARETDADISFGAGYAIDTFTAIEVRADYSVVSRKDASIDPGPRGLFTVGGQYVFSPLDGLSIKAGAKVAFENDTLDSKDLHIFRDVQATFSLTPTVDLVGAPRGGVDELALHSVILDTRW